MSTDVRVSFDALLKRYRLAAGLTQEELAGRAHLSARAVSALEQGVNRAPRKETVELLVAALSLDPSARASFVGAARRRVTPEGTSTRAVDPLVGRESELALLARHLSGEGPPALLLAGEPGIGKSRLLRETVEQAARYGWSVLTSGCQRREGHVPFSPLVEALEQQLDRLTGVQRRAALHGCSGLERLLPELTSALHQEVPAWALPVEQERRLIFGAVRRFLANVAGAAGTLLVLDDLQWAHTDALDLLITLLRAEEPVRVVAAYRNTEASPLGPIATLVGELAAAGLAQHRLLSALSTDETRRLFEVTLAKTGNEGAALSDRLLQRTGGLPFFIISWAQGLRRGPEQSEDALPWDVAASVRLRVAALPAEARLVLGAAAVVGREAARAVLSMAVGGSEEDLLTGLDVVCRAGLLVEAGETSYQFTHDVIREVVEADLGAGRRAYLHQRIAEALETEAGEPQVDLLAYHYARSDAQARAVKYLALAAVKARAQYANVTAVGYYQELVERLERLVRPLEAAAARIQLGATLTAIARYDEASAVLEPAASVYQAAGDLEDLGKVIALIGQIHRLRPTPGEGLARIRPILAGLQEAGPSEGLASLNMTLAHLCFAVGDYRGQLAAATRAADMARQVQANRLLADIEEARGSAMIMMGQVDEGMRVVEAAVPLAQTVNDLYAFGMAYWRLAKVQMLRGNWDMARQCAGQAREAAERLGDTPVAGGVVSVLGAVAFFSGDWAEARTFVAQFAAISDRLGFTWATPYALIDQGRLSLAEGRDADAERLLEQALRDAERIADLQAIRYAANLLAARDLRAGRPMAACHRLRALSDRPGLSEPDVTALLPNLAWANLELGDTAQAVTIAANAVSRARAIGYRFMLIDALHVQALVWLNTQAWDAAGIALAEGLALARLLPYPYGEARLLEDEGLLHAYLDAFGAARGQLEAAAVIFRRLGARFDLERIEREVATLPELSRSDQRNC
jgi:transcriptional regulator with XRE-family HTH domain/tetratricopeptide (TPR) repeat protein